MLGVLGFGVVITELALVLAGVGALSKIPGLSWMIEEGGTLLETIGVAIGKFIGGLAGGVSNGLTSQFPAIGTSLSQFMINAQPFFDGAKQIDSKMVDGVKSLAGAIAALTAANIFESVASWLTGSSSMEKFGQELAKFGPYFKTFYESIKGVDSKVVANSTNAANALAVFANNIPNAGGVAGWITGENSLSAFADELILFGPKLKVYADSVKGLDSNVVNNSANAAKALAAMAASLPNSGGVISWFTGSNTLSAFAEELTKFGPMIKEYALDVAGLDSNVITNSANAATALSVLAKNLPKTGGVVSWFAGDNDFEGFGEGLVSFGKALVDYSNTVKDLKPDTISASTGIATSLVTLQNGITKQGGLFSKDSDLKDFGKGLATFGEKLDDYYQNVKDIDATALSASITQTYRLIALVKSMSGIDTTGPESFSSVLSTLAKTALDTFVNTFTNSGTKVSTALSTLFTNMKTGISDRKPSLISTFSTLANDLVDTFDNSYMGFLSVGRNIIANLKLGVNLKANDFKAALVDLVASGVTSIRDKYSDYYNCGVYFVEGFVNGIDSRTFLAEVKAKAMAEAALKAAKKALLERSPSKETYGIGVNFVLGFANAIGEGIKRAYLVGRDFANSALSGTANVLSKISDAVNSKLDADPVITPVLDLSNVVSGASKLNSMLRMDKTLSVAGSIGQQRTVNATETLSGQVPVSVEFNQTINAPKDPNPIEIYRLTKNLISITRDVVKV